MLAHRVAGSASTRHALLLARTDPSRSLAKLKSLGYAGIEIPIAFVMKYGVDEFRAAAAALDLLVITQVFSSGSPPTPGNLGIASTAGIVHPADASFSGTRDVKGHCAVWAAQVRESARLGPVLASINSHSGKDYFNDAEADEFFSFATALEAELGVVVNHETHRARILYTPWAVPRILAAHPALRFTADLSHFSCVTETGARDPEVCAVVAALTPRVRHVHARVGFEEGPQVPDPRGEKWLPYLNDYIVWWTAIFKAAAERGEAVQTITPEFGPKDVSARSSDVPAPTRALTAPTLLLTHSMRGSTRTPARPSITSGT